MADCTVASFDAVDGSLPGLETWAMVLAGTTATWAGTPVLPVQASHLTMDRILTCAGQWKLLLRRSHVVAFVAPPRAGQTTQRRPSSCTKWNLHLSPSHPVAFVAPPRTPFAPLVPLPVVERT